ncbi:hypothetical protein O0L34_g16932 [Tuta absoluta]|nr:hypothetical protein O0L34_g16932 [Tuta absoluta]
MFQNDFAENRSESKSVPVKPFELFDTTWSTSNVRFGLAKDIEGPLSRPTSSQPEKQAFEFEDKKQGLPVSTFQDEPAISAVQPFIGPGSAPVCTFEDQAKTSTPTSTRALNQPAPTSTKESLAHRKSSCPKCVDEGKFCVNHCPNGNLPSTEITLSNHGQQERIASSRTKIQFKESSGCSKCRDKGVNCNKECPNLEPKLMESNQRYSLDSPSEERKNATKHAKHAAVIDSAGVCCNHTECATGCPKRREDVGLAGETNLARELNLSEELEIPDELKKWLPCLSGNCVKNCSRPASRPVSKVSVGVGTDYTSTEKVINNIVPTTKESSGPVEKICSKCFTTDKKCGKQCPNEISKRNKRQFPTSENPNSVPSVSTDFPKIVFTDIPEESFTVIPKRSCSKCLSINKTCASDCPGTDSKKVPSYDFNEIESEQPVAGCSKCPSTGKKCSSDCPKKILIEVAISNINKPQTNIKQPDAAVPSAVSTDLLEISCSKCLSTKKICSSACPGKVSYKVAVSNFEEPQSERPVAVPDVLETSCSKCPSVERTWLPLRIMDRSHSFGIPQTGLKSIIRVVLCITRALLVMGITLWILLLPLGDPKEACDAEICKKDSVAASVAHYSICHAYRFLTTSMRHTTVTFKDLIRGTKLNFYKFLSEMDKDDLCSVVCRLNDLYPEPKATFSWMFSRKNCKCKSKCCNRNKLN